MRTAYALVPSHLHGELVLVAAVPHSANEKTGDMVQLFILHPDMAPLAAVRSGEDHRVCGTCPQRWHLGGACYVNVAQAPQSVYHGWERRGGAEDGWDAVLEVCRGRKVRLGAYGDPSHLGPTLIRTIKSVAAGTTGYTHDWRRAPELAGLLMASCDTLGAVRHAEGKGWKAFVVSSKQPAWVKPCESLDGTQCRDCMACDGATGHRWIAPHGSRAARHGK